MKLFFKKKYTVDILEYFKKQPSKIHMIGITFWKIFFLEYYLTEGCYIFVWNILNRLWNQTFQHKGNQTNSFQEPSYLLVYSFPHKTLTFLCRTLFSVHTNEKKKTQTNILQTFVCKGVQTKSHPNSPVRRPLGYLKERHFSCTQIID